VMSPCYTNIQHFHQLTWWRHTLEKQQLLSTNIGFLFKSKSIAMLNVLMSNALLLNFTTKKQNYASLQSNLFSRQQAHIACIY